MTKYCIRLVLAGMIFLMAFTLAACGGGGSGGGGGTAFWLTDTPATNTYQAVYVTVNEVQVNHETNGWTTLTDLDLPAQFELLNLANGARAPLGIANLEPGHYTQMRLILSEEEGANYVIDADDNIIDLKVPSGGQTGIKLVNGFDITGSSTDIVLDFDVNKSVHVHPAGKTDKWVLRPTVRVVELENSVTGTVESGVDDSGAWVSAQSNAEEVAGASSESDGTYFMFIPVNMTGTPYNIVATKTVFDGDDVLEVYEPKCQSLGSTASAEYTGFDFTLTPAAATGTLSGSIIGLPVPGAEDTYTVSLSIRRTVDCSGVNTMVEVGSLNFSNPTGDPISYGPVTLPVGDYEIVAQADDAEAEGGVTILEPAPVSVTTDADTPLEIDFTPPAP